MVVLLLLLHLLVEVIVAAAEAVADTCKYAPDLQQV